MKQRILFVDDEPLALQGMQRMLRTMRSEWDMTFIEGGVAALEWLSKSAVDVVVSDMVMPGMNGVEFLDLVRQRFPKTIRLILSGYVDKELVLQSIRCSHRFLSKPCPPDTLKSAIAQVASYGSMLANDDVHALVCSMDWFSAVPSIYADFTEKLQEPAVSLGEVASFISQDIGMAATTLKLVNSGFYGSNNPVSSIAEAVSYLGVDTVKSLVFSIQAFSPFEADSFHSRALDQLWRHSLETAQNAKSIVVAENGSTALADAAFTAGLLHDAGKFLLVSNFPDHYSRAVHLAEAEQLELCDAEKRIFGVSHAEVGGCLFGLWGLPLAVVDAVMHHHRQEPGVSKEFTPLTAVHCANTRLRLRPGYRNLQALLKHDCAVLPEQAA